MRLISGIAKKARDRLSAIRRACAGQTQIAYDADSGRVLLPGRNGVPALVVPLDYEAIIPRQRSRAPFDALQEVFERDLEGMTAFCNQLAAHLDVAGVPQLAEDGCTPHWRNDYFTGDDARVASAIVRTFCPSQIIEIGSGHSTRFFRKAIRDGQLATRLISVDPRPRAEIRQLVDVAEEELLQELPLARFSDLKPGDVLFYDGSHLVFHGSDVTHFFLRVLPRVAAGVFVHVHDVFLPDEYPEHFDLRYYNEQYLLAAMLMIPGLWEILAPVNYLKQRGVLPEGGCSFWMRRRT